MEPEQILFQPGIIESICTNLKVEEISNLMKTYQITEVPCQIPFYDKIDRKQLTLPQINQHTLHIYNGIKNYGYRKFIDDLIYRYPEDQQLEIIKTLIKMGVNVNANIRHGWTMLMFFTQFNQILIVKFLLEHGADPNFSRTLKPLMLASKNGNNQMVNLLLDYGADINAVDIIYLRTALSYALQNKKLETVELLKKRGAR